MINYNLKNYLQVNNFILLIHFQPNSHHMYEDIDLSESETDTSADSDSEKEKNPGIVGKLKTAQLKSYEEKIKLSEIQREEELEMQKKQLEMIFKLLKAQNDNLSENDLKAQLNLYK